MMNTKNGGAHIDTAQLIATGAMSGPHRKTKPVTVPLTVRIMARAMRAIQSADAKLQALAQFRKVYAQYRPHHSATYAARIAYGVAFRGLPF